LQTINDFPASKDAKLGLQIDQESKKDQKNKFQQTIGTRQRAPRRQ